MITPSAPVMPQVHRNPFTNNHKENAIEQIESEIDYLRLELALMIHKNKSTKVLEGIADKITKARELLNEVKAI